MFSIPASELVNVVASVSSAGGTALDMGALLLTTSTKAPYGSLLSFTSAKAASDYFGGASVEADAARSYFAGFDKSTVKPASLLYTQYPTASTFAYLKGAKLTLTLAQLKAIPTGDLSVTASGVVKNASFIELANATSFSQAATIIGNRFSSTAIAVTFDSSANCFVITDSTAAGSASTMTFATGAMAEALGLTESAGAILSQGAVAATPAAFMDSVIAKSNNWATFTHLFDPDAVGANANKMAFANWNGAQGTRFMYVCWDSDVAPGLAANAPGSMGRQLEAAATSGTFLLGSGTAKHAAFICGVAASIDFGRRNGRITFAFKNQSGLAPLTTDQSVAANMYANGYNVYGSWATAADQWTALNRGVVSGQFKWADSYVNAIWLNASLQLALMSLLMNASSIPYNADGYSMIEAAILDPIESALLFGAIRKGVRLSNAQAVQINGMAGKQVSGVLESRGWYLQIDPAQPITRAARASPTMTLWYMDGGSIQKINLASIEVQ